MKRVDISKIIFFVTVIFFVFIYGVAVGTYQLFPHAILDRVKDTVYSDVTTLIGEVPNLTGTEPIHFLREARYDGAGVTVNKLPGGEKDLVLLSGFFQDDNGVRLIRRDGTIVADWRVRISELLPEAGQCRNPPATDWNATPHGTIATPGGDIVLSFESCGMVRVDRCGDVVWTTVPEITHHSPNFTEEGGIVIAGGEHVSGEEQEIPWPYDGSYWEDLVYKFSADGEMGLKVPLTRLFLENGMEWLLTATGRFGTRVNGEFHLNEVEELPAALAPDFPMFEAGDLMLSIRNRNLIVVTDRNAKRIKWWRIGPWIRQHDPDFQPGGTITVFDNHTDETSRGTIGGGSRIVEIDPATGETRVLYGGADGQRMYSAERSTHQIRPNGNVVVTEAQAGRAFEVDAEGNIVWEYVNRYDADRVTWMHDAQVYPVEYFNVTDWSCP